MISDTQNLFEEKLIIERYELEEEIAAIKNA